MQKQNSFSVTRPFIDDRHPDAAYVQVDRRIRKVRQAIEPVLGSPQNLGHEMCIAPARPDVSRSPPEANGLLLYHLLGEYDPPILAVILLLGIVTASLTTASGVLMSCTTVNGLRS